MPKEVRCANCGKRLALGRKVFNREVIDVIEPHNCGDVEDVGPIDTVTVSDPPRKSPKVILDSFPFVQKLNKARPEIERPSIKDTRPGRNEVASSIAPEGLRGRMMNLAGTASPAKEELAYDNEEDSVEMESGSSDDKD